ncbi:hypothetical protein [Clostridium beijerinckii]|jgi:hypothetical protein|uniref:Uncharacterized protein n=1 Tax=Clostridium beijerinckii TaxID=1520 RepID=A0AAE2RRI8_CLOBE|nr:hypothetical protein [Clostridium beijerinckii]MBF7808244.1 hypothetical protein [Clostridium beijerinckii]NRT21811.1 hypothetical protein [Clostridium beijerinckii]NRT65683.1 hypothetical protein [Clostridium beijerinckii]NRT82804.1 hypothetical protein [Clostridium beijerinckii]NRU52750.1 hypothetical protein [Clostridium beijerinckii]
MLKITMSYENETDKSKINEILSFIRPTGPVKSSNNGKYNKVYVNIK